MPPFIRPLGNPHDGKHTWLSFWGPCTQARLLTSDLFIFSTHTLCGAVSSCICGSGCNPTALTGCLEPLFRPHVSTGCCWHPSCERHIRRAEQTYTPLLAWGPHQLWTQLRNCHSEDQPPSHDEPEPPSKQLLSDSVRLKQAPGGTEFSHLPKEINKRVVRPCEDVPPASSTVGTFRRHPRDDVLGSDTRTSLNPVL